MHYTFQIVTKFTNTQDYLGRSLWVVILCTIVPSMSSRVAHRFSKFWKVINFGIAKI